MKVKLFTHCDLDGIGCGIVAKLAFKDNVDIEYCNHESVSKMVEDFLFNSNESHYDYVFITDISINEELVQKIDICMKKNNNFSKVLLFDHHITAMGLNKYKWCEVTEIYVFKDGISGNEILEKTCGTYQFYKYLIGEGLLNFVIDDKLLSSMWEYKVGIFVNLVRQYDTWLWNTKYNNIIPKQLNDLLYIYGRDRFIEIMMDILTPTSDFVSQYTLFSKTDKILLELNQEKIDRYIETKQKQIIERVILGYKAGIVFAEQYTSECGNVLSKSNPHLDFIVIINPSYSINYRTVKDNINLGNDVAKVYGGGGHPNAAGSPINDKFRNKIINLYFKRRKCEMIKLKITSVWNNIFKKK